MNNPQLKYNFYYDESFHDRAITQLDNLNLNIFAPNASAVFNYVFFGWKVEDIVSVEKEYLDFESRVRTIWGLTPTHEIKGISFSRKNFVRGCQSFNKEVYQIYTEYFDFLIKAQPFFQLGFQSKTERLVIEFLKNCRIPPFVDLVRFIYSLTKFIDLHRWNVLFCSFFQEPTLDVEKIRLNLIDLMSRKRNACDNIERMKMELRTLDEMIMVLSDISPKSSTDFNNRWDYSTIFFGFKKLLDEAKIEGKLTNILIDREKATLQSALEHHFTAQPVESCDVPLIRSADLLANFLGKMLIAIQLVIKEPEIASPDLIVANDYINKRYLPTDWFEISDKSFAFYQKVVTFFRTAKKLYWSSFVSIYGDGPSEVFSLFHYFGQYETFSDFKIITPKEHQERFNTFLLSFIKDKSGEVFSDTTFE